LADDPAAAAVGDRAGDHRRALLEPAPSRVLPPGLGDEVRAWVARGKPLEPAHIDSLRSTSPLGALLAPRWTSATAAARKSASASRTLAGTWCTGWSVS
jgi:hypothetical protein